MADANQISELFDEIEHAPADEVSLYIVRKTRVGTSIAYEVHTADIQESVGEMLLKSAKKALKKHLEDSDLYEYEPLLSPDSTAYFHINVDEVPEATRWTDHAQNVNLPLFDLANATNMHAYFVRLAPGVWGFTKRSAHSFLQKNKGMAILSKDGVFTRMKGTPAAFSDSFDAVLYGDDIYIFCPLATFETLFAYDQVMQKVIDENYHVLSEREWLQDSGKMRESIDRDKRKARKLFKILSRPDILEKITPEKVHKSIQTHNLALELDGNGRVVVTSANDVWTLLKLIDEDYYLGTFSGEKYEAHSKISI